MLTILFYTYAIITSCVVAGLAVNLYNTLYNGRIALEAVLSIKGNLTLAEKKQFTIEAHDKFLKEFDEEFKEYVHAKKIITVLIAVVYSLLACFFWWTKPITRLKITKDVLTSNWVEL